MLNFTEVFKQTVIDPWAEGYRRRADAESLHPLQRHRQVSSPDRARRRARSRCARNGAFRVWARSMVCGAWVELENRIKDQSYFLYPVPVARLPKFWLPLADLTKAEVRERADALGLPTAQKSESQDACFVTPNPPHVVVRRLTGEDPGEGRIVDENGRILGEHKGFDAFTVGQRRGLRDARRAVVCRGRARRDQRGRGAPRRSGCDGSGRVDGDALARHPVGPAGGREAALER